MGITEKNPGALDRLRMRCRYVGSPEFKTGLSQVLGATGMTQLQNGFVHGRDPYGNPWKDLTSRDGQPLRNRGHMAGSAHANQRNDGFTLSVDQGHPKTHQKGMTIHPVSAAALRFLVRGKQVFARAVTIPQRMIFPVASRGLGLWKAAFDRDASEFFKRVMGGSR